MKSDQHDLTRASGSRVFPDNFDGLVRLFIESDRLERRKHLVVSPSLTQQKCLRFPDHLATTAERFWEAYAADRYDWLLGGLDGGERDTVKEGKGKKEEMEKRKDGRAGNANGRNGDSTSRRNPTKYLVFEPKSSGLGNHLAGMMSAFALSVATKRVFLHEWTSSTEQ